MSNTVEIDGRILHPVKDATSFVSYSRDYITRLAREEKIVARTIAGQWFVDVESLVRYQNLSALEREVRERQLSEDIKKEHQVRQAVESKNYLHTKKAASLHHRALATATLVLTLGLVSGYSIHQALLIDNPQFGQLANTFNSYEVVDKNSELVLSTVANNKTKVYEANLSTQEEKSLGDISNGILLLPAGNDEATEDIFSDLVIVKKMSDGSERVVQVDEAGNLVGKEIPFVRVPTSKQDI